MDEHRRASIADALRRYRETVLEHSFTLLRILVEETEAQPDPPSWSPEVVQSERIEVFMNYLGPECATSAPDLLADNNRSEMTSRYGLDGVSHLSNDLQQRVD